jgi:photosynthesis system II assembly factor YCF48-like protein/BNR/Asp-box repeat protein
LNYAYGFGGDRGSTDRQLTAIHEAIHGIVYGFSDGFIGRIILNRRENVSQREGSEAINNFLNRHCRKIEKGFNKFGGAMFHNNVICMFLVTIFFASAMAQDTNCGRDFASVPGPFIFGRHYIDESGAKWSAGGNGTVSITYPSKMTKVFELKTDSDFSSIFIIDTQFGFVVGTNGKIFATKDSGNTWQEQKTKIKTRLEAINCVDYLTCWTVGQDGVALRTNDGGKNWRVKKVAGNRTLNGVDFVDQHTGWIVGQNGLTMKTIDGGHTWREVKVDVPSGSTLLTKGRVDWEAVRFSDVAHGCIAGFNAIACTSDGGSSWEINRLDDQSNSSNFFGFIFTKNEVRVLEECARDYISTDYGKSWQKIHQEVN